MNLWFQDAILIGALTTWLPFIAFLLILLLTRDDHRLSGELRLQRWRDHSPGPSFSWLDNGGRASRSTTPRVVHRGRDLYTFGYLLDSVSVLMLLLVAGISFLVQVYSLGYMAGIRDIHAILRFNHFLRGR